MARFSRIEVIQEMGNNGLVPLFYHADIAVCKKILSAIYEGGARILEFTNRGDHAHEIFAELSKYVEAHFPELILGVGSVTDAGSASMFIQSGANFVVTPVFRKDIAIVCNRKKILWSPGCASLTEIATAEELGCEIVKLFPAGTYGPGFIKAIRAPQPWTKVMPTGGVSTDPENLKSWFDNGAYCVGMGSKLMVKNEDGSYDYPRIKKLTTESLDLIQGFKRK